MNPKAQKGSVASNVVLIVIASWILVPLLWLASLSFKERVDALAWPPKIIFGPTLDNYMAIVDKGYGLTLLNSAIVGLVSTVIVLFLGIPAAYTLSRKYQDSTSNRILLILIGVRMIPPVVTVVPLFIIIVKLQLVNSYIPIAMVHAGIILPISTWLIKILFDKIPREVDEASVLDGANQWQVLSGQLVPIAGVGLLGVTFLSLALSWGEMFFSLILTGFDTRTVTVVMPSLATPHGTYWGEVGALATVGLVPGLFASLLLVKVFLGKGGPKGRMIK